MWEKSKDDAVNKNLLLMVRKFDFLCQHSFNRL